MTRVLLPFPLQRTVADATGHFAGTGRLDWRRFPDGESLVTIERGLDGALESWRMVSQLLAGPGWDAPGGPR